jgi:hypothetical protein
MADNEHRKEPPKPPTPSREEEARQAAVQEDIDDLRALIEELRKLTN